VAINTFEGARRIAKLIAVFIVVGFVIAIVSDSPREQVSFTITGPGELPVLGCETSGENKEYKYTETRRGKNVMLFLCFQERIFVTSKEKNPFMRLPMEGFDPDAYLASGNKGKFVDPDDVVKLIPYRVDKATGVVWGNTRISPEVTKYMSQVLDTFQIPEVEEDRINNRWWSSKLELVGMYFLGMLASLAGWWAFTWAVGWIVRGFMGIPRGSDSRG
jgi:hypothetical protein